MKKIMHIASFRGNIGDLINHQGFYRLFHQLFEDVEIEQVEIRDFYNSAYAKRTFDQHFLDCINYCDMLVLGGGGFFDAQWEYSATGTTMDFSKEFIDGIKIPVLVNAMGYHEYPNKEDTAIYDKFGCFLKNVIERKNWLITVRNDGSYERIVHRFGDDVAKKLVKVPDNGFFFTPTTNQISITHTDNVIGMCISNDLFCKQYNGNLSEDDLNAVFSDYITMLCQQGKKILLFPHTSADLVVIHKVLECVPNVYKQRNIQIAPYDTFSSKACDNLMYYYSKCNCIIGMRFHSVILSMCAKVPVVAVAGHEQIRALCEDVQMQRFCLKADDSFSVRKIDELVCLCMNRAAIEKMRLKTYDYLDAMKSRYVELVYEFVSCNTKEQS